MNQEEIKGLLPTDFADNARVWVYQSTRPFTAAQEGEIEEQLSQFAVQWQAHGRPVKGWGKLLFNRFVVMMADESQAAVSGCSTDGMVRVVKSLEKQYDCNFFDRLSITFLVKEKAEVLPMNQVQYALDKGYIDGSTLMFNNLVSTKEEFLSQWLLPLSESWLAPRLNFNPTHA